MFTSQKVKDLIVEVQSLKTKVSNLEKLLNKKVEPQVAISSKKVKVKKYKNMNGLIGTDMFKNKAELGKHLESLGYVNYAKHAYQIDFATQRFTTYPGGYTQLCHKRIKQIFDTVYGGNWTIIRG